MERQSKSENGVRQTKTGRWEALVRLGQDKATGKQRYESRTFDKKSQAKAWVLEKRGERAKGTVGPKLSKATLADYLTNRWLTEYRRKKDRSGKPRNTYNTECIIDKWIVRVQPGVPHLGGVKLNDLAVEHFDRLYATMEEQGMRRGVTYLHGIVRRALQFAVIKRELRSNPTDGATVPDDGEGEVVSFTKEQEERFLAAAVADRWSPLWLLLRDAGMRPGEAFALKWEDVDLKGTLDADGDRIYPVRVRHTLRRVGVRKQSGGATSWELVVPKTKTGERDIPISENTVAALLEWRDRQRQEKKRVGDRWQEHGFIFTSEIGTPFAAAQFVRLWDRVLREADKGEGIFGTWGPEPVKPESGPTPERKFKRLFTPYVLRHTMITRNYLNGMSLELISRRAGHTNPMFTFKRYGKGVQAQHTKVAAANFDQVMATVRRAQMKVS